MDRRAVRVAGMVLPWLILFTLAFGISLAWAEYPERPIRMTIGWPPGGTGDVTLRPLCAAAEKFLKQPITVENMPGATGTKHAAYLSSATPDGYTLGCMTISAITLMPHLVAVQYDPFKGFSPIMLYGQYAYGLVVPKNAPWKTFKEFIEYAKANPGKIKYGTMGHLSVLHVYMERLQKAIPGLKMVNIPFQGGAPLMTALVGGHLDAAALTTEFIPFVQSGDARLLASLGSTRLKAFPEIPTTAEMGYSLSLKGGLGIFGPKGLPAPIGTKLLTAFKESLKDKSFIRSVEMLEITPDSMAGAEFESFLRTQFEETGQVVKELSPK
jgi:tripartite-type tricarboxylate transporter receptor subunit TctC